MGYNTYLCGEKWVDPLHYTNGAWCGDCQCIYIGNSWDVIRWADTGNVPDPDLPKAITMVPSVAPMPQASIWLSATVRSIRLTTGSTPPSTRTSATAETATQLILASWVSSPLFIRGQLPRQSPISWDTSESKEQANFVCQKSRYHQQI